MQAFRAVLLLLGSVLTAAQTPTFGSQYTGDGTYYGDQSGSGHCSFQFSNSFTLAWTTGVYTGVAVNEPQYGTSAPCGMCIAFWGTGPGSGANPISTAVQYAIATDECPECLTGSLDLAQDGDGRWTIDWYPVQCDVGDSYFEYSFQGSNAEYVKMAITNTRVPAAAVSIEVDGVYQAMTKTVDNYWLADSSSYTFPTSVQVTSVLGDTVTDVVNVASPSEPSATPTPTAESVSPIPTPTAQSASPTTTPTSESVSPITTSTPESPPPASSTPPIPPSAEVIPSPAAVPAGTQQASTVVANVSSPAVHATAPTVAVTSQVNEEASVPGTVSSPSVNSSSSAVTATSTPDGETGLVSTPANCTLSVAALQQCGGRGGVCANQGANSSQCKDAEWDNACCTSGYYCKRSQQWSWTCQRTEANTTQTVGGVVADYHQCGGLGNCAESLCADAEWAGYSCYSGFACLRWDAYYWQCRDIPFAQAA
ncbi:MAG: hypothetical protein FRX49_05220 [Trebouxia sp. A1-2]|nr:MAG: hypothetical protein FRX49_05220 [Trebouxia sp. A1-2]